MPYISVVCGWACNLEKVELPHPLRALLEVQMARTKAIEDIHSNCDSNECTCSCHKELL